LISFPSLSTRVLVVDDDIAIQQMLSSYFGDYGIDVSVTHSRNGMCHQLKERNHALILLDLNLRGEDGLDLLREVRGDFDLPVIIMTGHRRDETDRVLGLELGADDYLTKPFGLREMLARVRVVLRRADQARAQNEKMAAQSRRSRNSSARAYWFGGWMLDRRTRQLRNPQDEPVMLTNGEHAPRRLSRSRPKAPVARTASAGDPDSRGCLRPQHRRADSAAAPKAGARSRRSAVHQDGAGRRLCLRGVG
jgi:two-component system, OmpR family, response regulator